MSGAGAAGAGGASGGPAEGGEAPAISVVIPHLNQPEHLVRCLDALAAQRDAPPFEIIVVDNGSAALPEEICAGHGARLLAEPEPGPGPARNRGVAAARAPLLAFIDADCIADPGWLAAIARAFADPEKKILGGDVRIWRENPARATMLEAYESVYAYQMRDYIRRKGFTGTGNLAVRREVLAAVGPFAGIAVAEDIDWGRRAGAKGHRIHYRPDMIAFHPARRSMKELYEKWDRHLAHFHRDVSGKRLGRLRWLARAAAVALSPLGEIVRILRSDRISGARERWLAFRAMTAVRLHRARVMAALAAGRRGGEAMSGAWNRGGAKNGPGDGDRA